MRHPLTLRPPRFLGGCLRVTYPWSAMQIGDDFLFPKEWFAGRSIRAMQRYLSSYASTVNGSYSTKQTQLGLVVRRVA